jgi:N-acetylglutamate synthase-like GNAT family acetyltransferase
MATMCGIVMTAAYFVPADSTDLAGIRELLASNALPTTDLSHLQHFIVAKVHGVIAAVAGIEVYGADALLRSVCVHEAQRGRGLAVAACELLVARAHASGVRCLYLLTETASGFFERRGFTVCARAAVPAAIAATAEFRTLCPASAICMKRELCDPVAMERS